MSDFVHHHYTPYAGDASFLAPATPRTKKLLHQVQGLIRQELEKGILDLDVNTPSTITSHKPGFIDKPNELILGLQTDAPLKRAIKPCGGIRLVEAAAESYGYTIPASVSRIFTLYRTTHNDGVFSAYSDEIKLLRRHHIITGLPDSYGRGRIIGDYRRLPLYGLDYLITERQDIFNQLPPDMTDDTIRLREEVTQQIIALKDLGLMAKSYGFDISQPAQDSRQALQWLYLAYLAAVKQQDGAAMSMGRIDAFLDIYFERDLKSGIYTEPQIQELLDDFVIKLRLVRHLRPPEYNALFAGDPVWVTIALGGTDKNNQSLVTKTSFRFLHTLTNLGPAPEPNLTVLWSQHLPPAWKQYCVSQSIATSSIQYENDDLMKPIFGDDYGISCCVSAMSLGHDMQFFGARANLAKTLLLSLNGGKEELSGETIIPNLKPAPATPYLDYDQVWPQFVKLLDWLAQRYAAAMNIIHYMHDKYYYESLQMAFHDPRPRRFMALGLAGLSVVTDSLSAIKYAKVRPVRDKNGLATSYQITGDYPKYGNDDNKVDQIAVDITKRFMAALRRCHTYRESIPTLSILTITSNVVYGKNTGATPDGRGSGVPFAPGANPMHGRDTNGAIASLNSVAKLPYSDCLDGISNTFSITPTSLGKTDPDRRNNLIQLLDGYFVGKSGHHLNVNVMTPEMLQDAQDHPEKYPQLTIRVSGYAVLFHRLSKEQQNEVIARTFHRNLR